MTDLYNEAVKEWIVRRLRSRGHHYTRDKIRTVAYGIDTGFHGSDVTPADEPRAAITYELKMYDRKIGHWSDAQGWVKTEESIEHLTPVAFVQECLAIYEELRANASDTVATVEEPGAA